MVMESKTPPVIIPMWLTGFDQLMPEGRAFPYKYLPRPGAELSVTFGSPVPADSIRQALLQRGHLLSSTPDSGLVDQEGTQEPKGWLGQEVKRSWESRLGIVEQVQNLSFRMATAEELPRIRSRVTSIIHDAVEDLGRSVSGRLLYSPRQ